MEEECDTFYEQLEETLAKYKSARNFIIGDFNRKVGVRTDDTEEAVGRYGYGSRINRGEKLVQFVMAHRMRIWNTYFKKELKEKWTWRSPDGKTRNEIDYILGDTLQDVTDTQVIQKLKLSTDHRMVRAILNIGRRTPLPPKIKHHNLDPNDKEEFQSNLRKNLV